MEQVDKLDEIFIWQEELNNAVFIKKDIKNRLGGILQMIDIKNSLDFGPNGLPNEWLRKYLEALQDESRELNDELLWKWWSKDNLDMQNIKVEIVDLMHFLVSLALSCGMTAADFHDKYKQKMLINHKRQENDYSKENKNEADNLGIK